MQSRALLLGLVLLGLFAPTAEALSRSATAPYSLALGVALFPEEACEEGQSQHGAACFHVRPGEKWVQVDVRDQTGRNIAARWAFMRGDEVLASGRFCYSEALLEIPNRTDRLVLVLGDSGGPEAKATPGCHLQRGIGGFVTATFHR